MVGIIVHGDNHFIVRGEVPGREAALALVRHWSVINIGQTTPPELRAWRISAKEFREDLEWAVEVPAESEHSPAVTRLLRELNARGIHVYNAAAESW